LAPYAHLQAGLAPFGEGAVEQGVQQQGPALKGQQRQIPHIVARVDELRVAGHLAQQVAIKQAAAHFHHQGQAGIGLVAEVQAAVHQVIRQNGVQALNGDESVQFLHVAFQT
jgi:hypothetical protein